MKKRRELDALVNGKIGRRKKYGEHELLRNESESSEIEEFSIDLPQKTVVRKWELIEIPYQHDIRLALKCLAVRHHRLNYSSVLYILVFYYSIC